MVWNLDVERGVAMKNPVKSLNPIAVLFAYSVVTMLVPDAPATAAMGGLAISYSNKAQSVSIESHLNNYSIGEHLKFGMGVRSSIFRSSLTSFSTAEASEISRNRIEHLESRQFTVLATNAIFFAEHEFNSTYGLSVSIDAVGFSLGNETELSSASKSSTANPTAFNLLIFDKHDRGTLNSHFLLTRKLKENLVISAGLAHQFVEYTSTESFEFNNRRFRLKNDALVLSVSRTFE